LCNCIVCTIVYNLVQGPVSLLMSGGITSTLRHNSLAVSTFGALQLLKAAYRNGHVSAAVEAEGHAASLT
jgi:hypothetical protein